MKSPSSQSYGFSNSHIWRWEWTIKKAEHQRIYAFEQWCWRKLLRVLWTARRSSESILKEISPENSLEATDAEAESPVVQPPAVNWLIWKDPNAGKNWRQEEKGMTEDEMVGWHHQLDGHEFRQALGISDKQGGLACCSPWATKCGTRLSNWTVTNKKLHTELAHLSLSRMSPTAQKGRKSCLL